MTDELMLPAGDPVLMELDPDTFHRVRCCECGDALFRDGDLLECAGCGRKRRWR